MFLLAGGWQVDGIIYHVIKSPLKLTLCYVMLCYVMMDNINMGLCENPMDEPSRLG